MSVLFEQVMKLPPLESRQLADDIYESLESDITQFRLTDEQKAETERRLEVFRRSPESGVSWESIQEKRRRIS